MLSSVGMFALEIEEADPGTSAVDSLSLVEQYEKLDAHSGNPKITLSNPTFGQDSSNEASFFVDLIGDECNPVCILEHSDVSTECSDTPEIEDTASDLDGKWWAGCVDISEEDDDVFYSMHREKPQFQQNMASACQQMEQVFTRTEGLSCAQKTQHREITYVDIDEEDDDVFFSVQRQTSEALNDAMIIFREEVGKNSLTISSDEAAMHRHELQAQDEELSLTVPPQLGEMAEDLVSVDRLHPSDDGSAQAQLRRIARSSMDQHALGTCDGTPGLLGELRGGRAQSVRNYLARKLNERVIESEEAF